MTAAAIARARTVASGAFWAIAERMLFVGIGLFVSGFLARHLGPSQFGLWQYLLGLGAVFGCWTLLFPETTVVPRLVSGRAERSETFANAVFGRIVCAAAAALGFTLFCLVQVPAESGLAVMTGIMALRLATLEPVATLNCWLLSQGRMRAVATAGMVAVVVRAATVVAIAALALSQRAWVTAGWVAEIACLGLVAWWAIRGGTAERPRLSWPRRRPLLALAKPSVGFLIAFGLQALLYRLDKIALQPRLSADAFGQYMAASQIFENLAVLSPVIARAVAPSTIYRADSSARELAALTLVTTLALAAAAVVLNLLAAPVTTLIFGSAFAPGAPLVAAMAWLAVLVAIESVLALALYRVGASGWTLAKWGAAVTVAAAYGFGIAGDRASAETGIIMLGLGFAVATAVNALAIWRLRPFGRAA